MGQIMVHNTHGKDNVERASLAFLVANTALNSGQEAIVLLTIEGVRRKVNMTLGRAVPLSIPVVYR